MAAMIVECATHPQFLSNTYLVAEQAGSPAFFVDAGGPVESLIEAAGRLRLTPTHLLLTHHHFDHVCAAPALRERWPQLEVLISPAERTMLEEGGGNAEGAAGLITGTVEAGQTLAIGAIEVRPLFTPGHTAGMLSFLVGSAPDVAAAQAPGRGTGARSSGSAPGGQGGAGAAVFTGDTLFRNSVGGVRAPGHTTYGDLRDSIMGTLMELAPETVIYPGHAQASTVAEEWSSNSFIRLWRGLDAEGSDPCVALGEPATLVLLAEDYDGGTKAWVRWQDGADDIVPGSQVQRRDASSGP